MLQFRLTVLVFVGQPVVLGALELKVRVAELTLLGSEVLKVLGAFVGVAELVFVIDSRAVLTTVGGPLGGGNGTKYVKPEDWIKR